MSKGMNEKRISKNQHLFRFFMVLLVIEIIIFIGVRGLIFMKKYEVRHKNKQLVEREILLNEYESSTGYAKFIAIKDMEDKLSEMYWFERIEKISEIFEDLKNVDYGNSDMITLSDFDVSLQELSLKGKVSTLKALYYNNTGHFEALLNRFHDLDFIENMTIKTYERVPDDKSFEFILHANIISDDGK